MIKTVLFDLDGTLVDTLLDLANATNHALAKNCFPIHETEKYKYFVGDGMPKLIERTLPEEHRDEGTRNTVLKDFLDYYGQHYCDSTHIYDGIPELISKLLQNDIKLAIITNKAQHMADAVVKKYFGDTFKIVFGKREGVPKKPDPTSTLKVIKQLNVKPEECIFMGDSGMDMATGVNCHTLPVGVLWGFRTADELLANGAKYLIKHPLELLDIMGI